MEDWFAKATHSRHAWFSMNSPGDSTGFRVYSIVGGRYTFLLTAAQTAGACSMFEFFIPPENGTPPHIHRREDEAFYIIDGEFEFGLGSEKIRVGPAGFVLGRRDVPHYFKNVGSTPGRIICAVTPAGLEEFFVEIGTALQSRGDAPIPPTPADFARIMQIAPRYGIELLVGQ